MTFPVAVSDTTFRYTLDALITRSDDLRRVASLVAHAASLIGGGSGFIGNPDIPAIRADLVTLAARIASTQRDVDGVVATIEPAESARATFVTGAPWPFVRSLTAPLTEVSPWVYAGPRATPVLEMGRDAAIAPPRNLSDRVARIPGSDQPIRIDRFDTPTGPRFEVYVAGTNFRAAPGDPWWAGGNLELLASGQSHSLSATETALRVAGVTPTTPIVITGHSQGGMIAVALAASDRYSVDAIFTVGAPVGLVDGAEDTVAIHVVHPEDPVPALGGVVRGNSGTTWVIHSEPRTVGTDAHLIDGYRSSVARIDAMAGVAPLVTPGAAENGVATWYRPR